MTIARDKLIEARRLHEEHPTMTWRQIGEAIGEYGEDVRSALRQGKHLAPIKMPVGDDSEYEQKEIVQFYLSDSGKSKGATARHFHISVWTVSKILALAGYPEEASPSVVHLLERHNKLRQQKPSNQRRRKAKEQYDATAVVSFYFGEGQRSKKVTGRKFGISHWLVAKILAQAGHPEESYPNILTLLGMNITTQESPNEELPQVAIKPSNQDGDILSQLCDGLMGYRSKLEGLEAENARLKAKIEQQREAAVKLQQWVIDTQEQIARLR